jgi:hypothetical protein
MSTRVSVMHFLAAGYDTNPWEYYEVGIDKVKVPKPLRLPPREIDSQVESWDASKLCLPWFSVFGLVDCFLMHEGACYAFHITWEERHEFELSTLWSFREKLGLGIHGTLNLFFISPKYAESYRTRAKEEYLAKNERLDAPMDSFNQKELLSKEDVAVMWANTNIYTAAPKDDDWTMAIHAWQRRH